MSRGFHSSGKRQREAEKAQKKREKAQRRREKREQGPAEIEITSAEEMTGPLPSIDDAMRAITEQDQSPRGAAAIPVRLFVGGLSWNTTAGDLETAFSEFGDVAEAVVVKDRDTGSSRGFGFVTMQSRKDAPKAIDALSGAELDGRTIVVRIATDRR